MVIYTNNKILDCERNVSVEEINDFEKKHGFKFPESIKLHYLNYNGGQPEKMYFGDLGLHEFLSIKYGESQIEDTLNSLITDKLIPNWIIPFAIDEGGDYYCFSVREGEEGAIYIWRNDDFDYDDIEAGITYVTDSISAFINGMTEDIED